MSVFIIFVNLSKTLIIPRKIQRNITRNVNSSYVKPPLFLSDVNQTWIFSKDFKKIFKWKISWKSVHSDPSCFVQTDRQDDANSRF